MIPEILDVNEEEFYNYKFICKAFIVSNLLIGINPQKHGWHLSKPLQDVVISTMLVKVYYKTWFTKRTSFSLNNANLRE